MHKDAQTDTIMKYDAITTDIKKCSLTKDKYKQEYNK